MMNSLKNNPAFRARRLILWVLALAYFFVYFHRLSLSVVADELAKEFSATAGSIGFLGSVYFYCYALMQFPSGLLSDSIGPRKTVAFFLIIASFGSVLFAFSPNIETAFAGRVLVGLGVAMVFVPAMKIFSQWFRASEFAMMAGILNAVGGVGVLAGTWLLALMAESLGWRLSFCLIGLCTVVISVLAWIIVRDRPDERERAALFEGDAREEKGPGENAVNIGALEGARRVISEKYFWPLAVWYFFDCGIFFGFGALWGGPYLMDVYGMTRTEAGSVLSMIAWGMILGSPFLGFLSDKVLKSRKKVFLICSLSLILLLLFLNIFPSGLPRTALYVFFFFFSICSSSIVVVGFTMAKELFPVEIAGASIGAVNLFPFLGGAVFMPLLGSVLDFYSKSNGALPTEAYSALISILLGSSVIAAACAFFMKETFPGPQS
jgi:sugar phosphate permease